MNTKQESRIESLLSTAIRRGRWTEWLGWWGGSREDALDIVARDLRITAYQGKAYLLSHLLEGVDGASPRSSFEEYADDLEVAVGAVVAELTTQIPAVASTGVEIVCRALGENPNVQTSEIATMIKQRRTF